MAPANPTGRRPRPAPSPTLHPIYRPSPETEQPQAWAPSPVGSLEPPSGGLTAVGSTSSSFRPASKKRTTPDTCFARQRPKLPVIFADVIGIVLPLGFIAFAVVICKIDGTRTNPDAPYGTRTNSLGPYKDPINIFATAFPIVFAALLGRLISMFVRWKLERGAGLLFMERLLGSRSVGNTVLTMFLMPLSWITIILVLVWAFSPLGAQSILRILDTQMQVVYSNSITSYFNTDVTSWLASPNMIGAGLDGQILSRLAFISSMYGAALLSSDAVKAGPSDVWGNLKIPFVQGYDTIKDWQAALPNNSTTLLSSSALVGLPIVGVPYGNSTFEIESSYIYLDPESTELNSFNGSVFNRTYMNNQRLGMRVSSWGIGPPNGTWQGRNHIGVTEEDSATWNLALDTLISPFWDIRAAPHMKFRPGPNSTTPYSPRYFTNMSDIAANQTRLRLEVEMLEPNREDSVQIFTAYFRVTQKYVQSRVNCTHANGADDRPFCSVVEHRPSQRPHAPEDITPLSFPLLFGFVSDRLPKAMSVPGLANAGPGFGADPSIAYLVNPSIGSILPPPTKPAGEELQQILVQKYQLTTLPPKVIAVRLSQLLNTYLLLGQSFEVATRSNDPDASLADVLGRNVTAEVRNVQEMYHVHVEWMALYIAAAVVLLIGGVLATVLAHSALGPEVLGFASSVLRDSRFVDIEDEHRRLDGVDLATKLGGKRFKFGFVDGPAAVGEGRPLLGVGAEEHVQGLKG